MAAEHPEGHVFYRRMARSHPVVVRGEGVCLVDAEGRRYIDASGGPLVVNIGHGVREIAQAVAKQAGEVAYVHGNLFTTRVMQAYCARLAEKVPLPESRFYPVCSGSEAVETALKFARQLQVARGEPQRARCIARWGSYHGATLGGLAVSGKASMRALYEPMFRDMPHIAAPYCYRCPLGLSYPTCDLACARQLEDQIEREGPEQVAAFIAEPVGGATLGAVVPPSEYWPLIREICDRYGVVLIADEVLTGFGRTGAWFAMDHMGVQADVMAMAKGAAGGYVPFALAAMRGRDVETIRCVHGDFDHGGTFSHHAVGAAAGLATLDYLEKHDLVARAARLGSRLGACLREALADLSCVGDVRGIGMMWAVEFVAVRKSKEPYPAGVHFADRVCRRSMERGVLFYPGHGSADGVRGDHLMIAPPYVVSEAEIDIILETLRLSILDVMGEVQ